MNTTAAFKTLLFVIGVGVVTGYADWKVKTDISPKESIARDIRKCTEDRQGAAFTLSGGLATRESRMASDRTVGDCKAYVEGGNNPLAEPVHASLDDPAEQKRQRRYASGQMMSQSREHCLAMLEDARKHSPGGLNPNFVARTKASCDDLYSDAVQ